MEAPPEPRSRRRARALPPQHGPAMASHVASTWPRPCCTAQPPPAALYARTTVRLRLWVPSMGTDKMPVRPGRPCAAMAMATRLMAETGMMMPASGSDGSCWSKVKDFHGPHLWTAGLAGPGPRRRTRTSKGDPDLEGATVGEPSGAASGGLVAHSRCHVPGGLSAARWHTHGARGSRLCTMRITPDHATPRPVCPQAMPEAVRVFRPVALAPGGLGSQRYQVWCDMRV